MQDPLLQPEQKALKDFKCQHYLLLVMISTFGPFIQDFYLPMTPQIGIDLNTTELMVN